MTKQPKKPHKPSMLQVLQSIIAAAFGVQSSKKHQQDLEQGNPMVYIAWGIVFTILLILFIAFLVKFALWQLQA